MITMAILGVIMVGGSDFLIQTVRNANQATIENDVRENASLILQDVAAQIRQAKCVYSTATLLQISDDAVDATCSNGNTVTYSQDGNGVVTKSGVGVLNSANTAILDCSAGGTAACGGTGSSCQPGLVISPAGKVPDDVPVTVSVWAQQLPGLVRSDFCASVKLSDSITLRTK